MSSRLLTLARSAGEQQAGEAAQPQAESCELCSEPIGPGHRHLIDLDSRDLLCACRACALLFDRESAGGGHLRLIGERRLRLEGFELDDALWDRLRIPVGMAFFFRNSRAERVSAFYPSPMGPTESLLELDAWTEIEAANPVLGELADDVEALLVNRAGDARAHWLVPLDDCYELVGLIRTRWKGLGGGTEVWQAIDEFFEQLNAKSRPAPLAGAGAEEARR